MIAPDEAAVQHYNAAVKAWDDAYADRNGLPRVEWGTSPEPLDTLTRKA